MLETIHEYAREKLAESGEGNALRREHALYFMALAEEAEPQFRGPRQQDWLDRLGDEYDNIKAALDGVSQHQQSTLGPGVSNEEQAEGVADQATEIGLLIAVSLWHFWVVKGLLTQGREHLRRLLELPKSEATTQGHPLSALRVSSTLRSRSRAKALNGAGDLAWRQGDYSSAQSLLSAALGLGER
jgi:non-specific serine/threonine protein kinase